LPVGAVQAYVDSTLGDSSVNTCCELDAERAFVERPGAAGVGDDRRVVPRLDRISVVPTRFISTRRSL
jgi:hypothetical protein